MAQYNNSPSVPTPVKHQLFTVDITRRTTKDGNVFVNAKTYVNELLDSFIIGEDNQWKMAFSDEIDILRDHVRTALGGTKVNFYKAAINAQNALFISVNNSADKKSPPAINFMIDDKSPNALAALTHVVTKFVTDHYNIGVLSTLDDLIRTAKFLMRENNQALFNAAFFMFMLMDAKTDPPAYMLTQVCTTHVDYHFETFEFKKAKDAKVRRHTFSIDHLNTSRASLSTLKGDKAFSPIRFEAQKFTSPVFYETDFLKVVFDGMSKFERKKHVTVDLAWDMY